MCTALLLRPIDAAPLIRYSCSFCEKKMCAPVPLRVRVSTQVRAVIVENTFISVSHMVDKLMPMLSGIKWLVLRLRWDNEEKARRLTRPVLYISGKRPSALASRPLRGVWFAGGPGVDVLFWVFSASLVCENYRNALV